MQALDCLQFFSCEVNSCDTLLTGKTVQRTAGVGGGGALNCQNNTFYTIECSNDNATADFSVKDGNAMK